MTTLTPSNLLHPSANPHSARRPFGEGLVEAEIGCHGDAYDPIADLYYSEPLAHEFEAITLDVQPIDIIHATDPDCWCWSDDAHVRAGTFCDECVERKRRELAEVIEVVRPVRRGPSDLDIAWSMGYSAALDSPGRVEAPKTLTNAERDGFLAGYAEGCVAYHDREMAAIDEARLQAEAAAEMEVCRG